jgi:hypothetical protein
MKMDPVSEMLFLESETVGRVQNFSNPKWIDDIQRLEDEIYVKQI